MGKLVESDMEIFHKVKMIENEYEAVIKMHELSESSCSNVYALYFLRKCNLGYADELNFPPNISDYTIESIVNSWKSKSNKDYMSKYYKEILSETGYDLYYKLNSNEKKIRKRIVDGKQKYIISTRMTTATSFCENCEKKRVKVTQERFLQSMATLKKIYDYLISHSNNEYIVCSEEMLTFTMHVQGRGISKNQLTYAGNNGLKGEYESSLFAVNEDNLILYFYDDLSQFFDLSVINIDVRFEKKLVKNNNIDHGKEKVNGASIKRNSAYVYYGLSNMPLTEVQKCCIPEFAGVYILRDESYNRYVGQGKNIIKEAVSKTSSAKSLVCKAYRNGTQFWLEDCICGYADGRALNMNDIEAECIKYYNSHESEGGYNRSWGNKNAIMFKGKEIKQLKNITVNDNSSGQTNISEIC